MTTRASWSADCCAESGAAVSTAVSAAAALERFQADRPDVIVSDIGLPGEDGYSLIGSVRALEGGAGPACRPSP